MQRAERRTGFNVCTVDAVILIIHSVVLIIHCNVAHSVPRLTVHAKRPATIMQPWGSTGALVCGRSGATPDSKRGAVRELHSLSAAPLRRAPCGRSSPAADAGQRCAEIGVRKTGHRPWSQRRRHVRTDEGGLPVVQSHVRFASLRLAPHPEEARGLSPPGAGLEALSELQPFRTALPSYFIPIQEDGLGALAADRSRDGSRR